MTNGSRVSVTVYSPANMSAIDGSSVWVQTVTLALARVSRVDVSLLLSHPVTNPRLVTPLLEDPAVSVIDPFADGSRGGKALVPSEAAHLLAAAPPDVVVVRGSEAARTLAAEPELTGRLWPYLTDVPQHVLDVDDDARGLFSEVMAASPVILCQTEEMRTFLEGCYPEVAEKGWLLPPTIPEGIERNVVPSPDHSNLRLCYSGKFARRWNTYEMCELPALLRAQGITAHLTMVGDKINRDPDRPEFVPAMRRRLERSAGVDWVGGVSRERSIELMAGAHVGLSWRSPELDDSLELSTKLLEYCAAGTPPLLNRTAMHERIFGADYPLFVNDQDDVIEVLTRLCTDADTYRVAMTAVSDITAGYTLEKTVDRLAQLVERLHPTDGATADGAQLADVDLFDRPKMGGAQFHVAFFTSIDTTPDELAQLADLIKRVRAEDPRLILFLQGQLSDAPEVTRELAALLQGVGPHGVVVDGERPGRAGWLRKIGFVVGLSDPVDPRIEEASASGAVPVLLDGEGPRDPWYHQSLSSMSEYLVRVARDRTEWLTASQTAKGVTSPSSD